MTRHRFPTTRQSARYILYVKCDGRWQEAVRGELEPLGMIDAALQAPGVTAAYVTDRTTDRVVCIRERPRKEDPGKRPL